MRRYRAVVILSMLMAVSTAACSESSPNQTSPNQTSALPTSPEPPVAPGTALDETTRFAFDEVTTPPQGSESFSGRWQVRPEQAAPSPPNALCQTATATFPAFALSEERYADLVMSTRFKTISGREDRAAALIFHVQDSANFYILRSNSLEGNVNLYSYVSGRRSTIKEAMVPVPTGEWAALGVEVTGSRVTGQLDGRVVLTVDDDTFTDAGRVGLWTKADSVTCFDDVEVQRR